MKKLALISVTDKTGVADFAQGLSKRGFEILSTGNTSKVLQESEIDVTGVSYYTGMPEILEGRVKTLHPKIHAGLLAKPSDEKHLAEMDELNIRRIEVLAVNLYPFEQTVQMGASRQQAIENIDIGGPAMIRAAAKNAEFVFVVVDPSDYSKVLDAIDKNDADFRETLRAKAFSHTAYYDSMISEYFGTGLSTEQNSTITFGYRLAYALRYGENPHQKGGLYLSPFGERGVVGAKQLWGKELSFNNLLDADAAWELASDLERLHKNSGRSCVIVKHGNPCGAAWLTRLSESFLAARNSDPISAFGGIVACPGELNVDAAEAMTQQGNFFEVIVCCSIGEQALDVFKNRAGWGKDIRILAAGDIPHEKFLTVRTLRGGALIQEADTEDPSEWNWVSNRKPSQEEERAAKNAWVAVKHVKSNAIAIASQGQLLGIGAGQLNRVQSVRLAIAQAGKDCKGAAMASDAFFPFTDNVIEAANAGITTFVQPGGSKKDTEVIACCNEMGLAMALTGVRHFRH